MNNPFEYTPATACDAAFQRLTDKLNELKMSSHPDAINFCRELNAGKMLGVLIAADNEGAHHTLYAFSGQLGCGGFHFPGFVEPPFDYLQPDGYFKTKEREISRLNEEIAIFENRELAEAGAEYEMMRESAEDELKVRKEEFLLSKQARDSRRNSGNVSEEERAGMIRQSQFEKAELRRLKKKLNLSLSPYKNKLEAVSARLESMKQERRIESEKLQKWLFDNFTLLNARGESHSLSDIFADTPLAAPPSGAGECCGPKLLHAAYIRGWHPESMAEYWYGNSKEGEVRIHGHFYPACRGKCLPVLTWMLQGLDVNPPLHNFSSGGLRHSPEIVFENEWFCVVDKPGGMLSVPGKEEADSVQEWLSSKYGPDRFVKPAHRLDRDTSGLLIAALSPQAYKTLQTLFATRKVKKTYIAELEGDYTTRNIPPSGRIELPLTPDWLDRPRQRVDYVDGKESVTEYHFLNTADGRSRVAFYPHTGRTHQLRVHAASESGLGMPIIGDPLYGRGNGKNDGRMHLHAQKLEFTFPNDGIFYSFESNIPF